MKCRQLTANQSRRKYWNEMKDIKYGVVEKMNTKEMNDKMTPVIYISEMIDKKDLDGRSKVNRMVEKWFKDESQFMVEKDVEPIMKKIEYALEKGIEPELTEGEIKMAKAWIIMTNNVTNEMDLKTHRDSRKTVPMMTSMDMKANEEFTLKDYTAKELKDPNVVMKFPKEAFEKILKEPEDPSIDIEADTERYVEEENKKRIEAKNKAQAISQKMAVMNQTHQAPTPTLQVPLKMTKTQAISHKGKTIETVWKNGYAEYNGKPIHYDPYDATFMVKKVQIPSRKVAIPLRMLIVGEDRECVTAIPLIDHFLKQKDEHDRLRDERRKAREDEERKELEECKQKAFEATVILFDDRIRLYTENEQYKDKILVMSREMKIKMLTDKKSRGTWSIAAMDEQERDDGKNLVYVRMIEKVKEYDEEQERKLKLDIFGVEEAVFEGYIYTLRGKLTVTSNMKDPEKDIYIPARYRNIRQITELNLPDILTNMGRWKLKFHHLNEKDNTIVVDPVEYLGRYEESNQSEN